MLYSADSEDEISSTGCSKLPSDLTSTKNIQRFFLAGLRPAKSNTHRDTRQADIVAPEHNAAHVKTFDRICPKPVVVVVKVNGQPCRVLLNSGSLSDFISTTLVDQLKLKLVELDKPLPLQLAMSGSRSKVKVQTTVNFKYQNISEQWLFDVINVDSYDLILGTPFLFQHQVLLGFNPSQVNVQSDASLLIKGTQVLALESRQTEIANNHIESLVENLSQYALPICKDTSETLLPPLRAVNHPVPMIDPNRVYKQCPLRCPELLRPLWNVKHDEYLWTRHWKFHSGLNAVLLMMLKKPTKDGELRLRTVCETCEQNKNSRRLTSLLPDIETILCNVESHPYRSLIDGKDTYKQIHVKPGDVDKILFNTSDGTMVSLVMQIGDCNASAMYQTLMNHIFSDYIGLFMDVYLDDTVIYSDTPEEHVAHVKKIIDRLHEHQFYLSAHKLQFFKEELKILGHVIDNDGIHMDPVKVESVTNWKTPTNKGLLASFIRSVGYLAPGCMNVRVLMHILSKVAAPIAVALDAH